MAYSIQFGSHIAILHYKLVTPPVELVTNTHNNNKLYTAEETPLIEIENFTMVKYGYVKKARPSSFLTSIAPT